MAEGKESAEMSTPRRGSKKVPKGMREVKRARDKNEEKRVRRLIVRKKMRCRPE